MKEEDAFALIAYRMERANESLQAAEIMLENGMLIFAMNRVYYSMFYAVQAMLATRGVSFSKHGKVKAYFNREMIKRGIFPIAMGKLFNKAFEYRQKFDYVDFAVPDQEMVKDYISAAHGFLEHVQQYLGEQQTHSYHP